MLGCIPPLASAGGVFLCLEVTTASVVRAGGIVTIWFRRLSFLLQYQPLVFLPLGLDGKLATASLDGPFEVFLIH